MRKPATQHLETLAVHGGQKPDPVTDARALPLYRTTAYVFNSAKQAADRFALKEAGGIYTRLGHPTEYALEECVTLLEGGVGAVTAASGTAAIFNTIINIAKHGDEIVSANNLYGGTYTMFNDILPQFGITVSFVKPNDFEALEKAINDRTRAVFVETIGNPTLNVCDLERYVTIAHKHGLPVAVDSTFTPPCLLRPFDYGADIVIHSLSKWMCGHGTCIGGIAVDSGTFDWKNQRFALYNEPDNSYHGLRWAHDIGDLPPFITRMRTVPLRNLGACLSPDNAWLFVQGIETLPLRMERHCFNASKVATYLESHAKVAWVRYPGLASHPDHALAKKYLKHGFGGMVVFGVKPSHGSSKEGGQRFIENLQLFSHLANVGDAKSLAIHSGSTTHSQLTDEQQKAGGLSPELVRLSIGIEHIDDIIADLDQALKHV